MRDAFKPPTSTRQVQSEAAEIGAGVVATTRRKDASSATSTINVLTPRASAGGRRVHNSTLSLVGSPEATPSGYRSRRSRHASRDGAAKAVPQAADAPSATAVSRKARRLISLMNGWPHHDTIVAEKDAP